MSTISILVQDLEERAASPSFARNQQDCRKQAKLRSLIDSIIYPLRELEELATKYSSLSTAKKNNWERLRFASKSIDGIRARLILHTSAAQSFLDGLANQSVTRIERKSDETNAALTRVEQVLADIVRDIKHGSRDPSVVSDERWNIWTELKRELRIEGYPVEVVQQHKDQIKQYLLDLLQGAGLRDEIPLDELDPTDLDVSNDEAQSSSGSQISKTIIAATRRIQVEVQPSRSLQSRYATIVPSNPPSRPLALILLLSITVACARLLQSVMQVRRPIVAKRSELTVSNFLYQQSMANEPFAGYPANLSTKEVEPISTVNANQVTLGLKAGLFKNEHFIRFTCDNAFQAQEWIDQLSPLFDPKLVDESAITVRPFQLSANEEASRALQAVTATSPAQLVDASYCPRSRLELGGHYWDIYSKEPPCGHQHE